MLIVTFTMFFIVVVFGVVRIVGFVKRGMFGVTILVVGWMLMMGILSGCHSLVGSLIRVLSCSLHPAAQVTTSRFFTH